MSSVSANVPFHGARQWSGQRRMHEHGCNNVRRCETGQDEPQLSAQATARRRSGGLPARQQDMVFPRARDRRTATALASYLSTAGFTDWDMEVLGLDLYI